ncbi:MAG TPA: redoxin family protein [Patescibacteria group bacterium]|nr:redoxin family protein [Patescibacteria group bacterium]
MASGRAAGALTAAPLMVHRDAQWITVGQVSGSVPAAPVEQQLLEINLATGTYDGVRLGSDTQAVSFSVAAGQVVPLLLGVDAGRLIPGGVYAGNDEVNLGLGELAGKFVAMPAFDLVDQAGRGFNQDTTAGRDLVIAAFHTTCHETCPLYTAMFFQIAKQMPPDVLLAEVTTDPAVDTPAVLSGYAGGIGAKWTFATGTRDELTSFWKPFGVELASGDTHTSTLALVDRHGYIRLVYRGVPDVGNAIPPSLVTGLSASGLAELASGGDGWGAPDVLQALLTIAGPERAAAPASGSAPSFQLAATSGPKVGLADLAGKPAVINFWASYCPPCKAELPLLERQTGAAAGMRLVLVNEGDSPQTARSFLDSAGVHSPSLLDSDLSVGKAYRVSALPMTVFLRSDGTIAAVHVGQLSEAVLAAELSTLASQ